MRRQNVTRLPHFLRSLAMTLVVLIVSTGTLLAENVNFEATVNSPRVSMDEVMQLTLTITGVNDSLDPVSLPVIEGFSAKYLGPSTSVSIVNGVYHSERSFLYELFPNKVGRFQIPTITATIAGHTYTTHPIDVEVFASSAQAQVSNGAADQNQGPGSESLKDKILVVVDVNKKDVYLNERVPVTIKLLVNGVPIRDIQYPQFEKQGFVVDDFEKPSQTAQVLDGVRYDTVRFKTNIYPDRLGDLIFGPAQIQGNVLYKAHSENPLSQENNFFGGDILSSFFDSYTTRPVNVASEPVKLHVSSLPEDDRPKDFSGAIGQFDFQANVSPLKVKAGDPLTLKMDLKGNGNFKNLKIPEFQAAGFKTYAPQVKATSDEKTVEEVIIPISAAVKEVPALSFSYFDPSLKSYKTITQGPFPIQVTAPSADQEFKAVGFTDISHEPSMLPAKQFSFGKLVHSIQRFLVKLFKSTRFLVSAGLILVAGLFYFLWQRFQDRLENDPAFARRIKAYKEARQSLGAAEGYISSGKVKDFYALLSKVLRDYLANKWDQPSASLSVEEIIKRLKKIQMDEGHIGQVKSILEQSDLVCFAGVNRDASQMKSDLMLTQNLIKDWDSII